VRLKTGEKKKKKREENGKDDIEGTVLTSQEKKKLRSFSLHGHLSGEREGGKIR